MRRKTQNSKLKTQNNTILAKIIAKTKKDLDKRKKDITFSVIQNEVKDLKIKSLDSSPAKPVLNDNAFYKAMQSPKQGTVAIIAEVKFTSPAEGFLGSNDQLLSKVKEYEKAGADAISIVTEKHFFDGDPQFVGKIKQVTNLPVLEKDFVLDPYQIYEMVKDGADAILLIAKLLSEDELIKFVKLAQRLGLEPVVEINNELDLKKALKTKTKIIAVNARDLTSFMVDVDRACLLIKKIPGKFVKLGFSGVSTRVEVKKYKNAGANGVLIGTSLMKAKKISEYIEGVRV